MRLFVLTKAHDLHQQQLSCSLILLSKYSDEFDLVCLYQLYFPHTKLYPNYLVRCTGVGGYNCSNLWLIHVLKLMVYEKQNESPCKGAFCNNCALCNNAHIL